MERIEPPWREIREWTPDEDPDLDRFNRPRKAPEPDPDFDQRSTRRAPEIPLGEGRILVLED